MNIRHWFFSYLLFLLFPLISIAGSPIIPTPNSIETKEGFFSYSNGFDIKITRGDNATKRVQQLLSDSVIAKKIPIVPFAKTGIILNLLPASGGDIYSENYTLSITPTTITITSTGNAGLFYGVQSLLQLFRASNTRQIPCAEIKDTPAYNFRGFQLDVVHHYFDVAVLKKYLDIMAKLKMNQFQWQLSSNEKSSVQFKNTIAKADTANSYTPEQVKALVKYAQERFINIIPEIYFPYATSDSEIVRNKQLADEVIAVFPGTFIQIGNAITDDSTLAYLQRKNKKIIGKDKNINSSAILLSYKSEKSGLLAATKNTDVIMATRQYCSLDYYQDWVDEKMEFSMTFLPLSKAYSFSPAGKLKDANTIKHILGGQACLFTTYIKNEDALDYQSFPRMLALAECFWTTKSNKNFKDFERRVKILKDYFYKEKEVYIDLVRIRPKKQQ
ncbi:MAG: family 20 glycosylhydrolase [Chitinophagales bacterium]